MMVQLTTLEGTYNLEFSHGKAVVLGSEHVGCASQECSIANSSQSTTTYGILKI